MKDETFQDLAALQRSKDVVKHRTYQVGRERVEDFTHLRVAGNLLDVEQVLHVLIVATFLKRQQRRILQREHGHCRHEGSQGNAGQRHNSRGLE